MRAIDAEDICDKIKDMVDEEVIEIIEDAPDIELPVYHGSDIKIAAMRIIKELKSEMEARKDIDHIPEHDIIAINETYDVVRIALIEEPEPEFKELYNNEIEDGNEELVEEESIEEGQDNSEDNIEEPEDEIVDESEYIEGSEDEHDQEEIVEDLEEPEENEYEDSEEEINNDSEEPEEIVEE